MENVRDRIRAYMNKSLNGYTVRDNDDIFASGYVNSLFAMQLVQFIETEFGIVLDGEDLDFKNFKSIDAMTGFVELKVKGRAA